jgi:hypothetical protein
VKPERLLALPQLSGNFEFASIVVLLVASVFMRGPGSRFIYFQF